MFCNVFAVQEAQNVENHWLCNVFWGSMSSREGQGRQCLGLDLGLGLGLGLGFCLSLGFGFGFGFCLSLV